MSGAANSVGGVLGFNQSNSPKYEKYNMDTAMKTGNPGVNSILGSSSMIKNPDGSYSMQYNASDNDTQRTNLMKNILSGMGDTTGAEQFYNNAAARANKEYSDQRRNLDENLTNRGIAVGNKQYSESMGNLADKQNQALGELATNSIFKGQDYDSNLINQANALAQGRDIGQLASIGSSLKNDNYADYLTQSNAAASAKAAANSKQGTGLLGTIGGILGMS
jgi:hypothetical protein